MPWLTECYEWGLLQRLAALLASRKAYSQPSSRDWKIAADDGQTYHNRALESELRKLFLLRESDIPVENDDLKQSRNKLKGICNLLEKTVNSEFTTATGVISSYPRLSGLINYLKRLDDEESSATFDLAYGQNLALFNVGRDDREECLQIFTECNKFMENIYQTCQKPGTGSACTVKGHSWRDLKTRDEASAIFRLLFQRFTCETSHEVLLKVPEIPTEGERYPLLQLLLSSCTDTDNWQEILYGSDLHVDCIREFDDLCLEMERFAGHGQELHILAEKHQLLGSWYLQTIGKPSFQSLKKTSLDEMIASGQFKPLTCNSFLDSSSISRYSLGQKRALAVKLGYCLMDFFDSNLDSKRIHFLGPCGGIVDDERLYLSFSSKLPSLPEFRIFKMGHPVLLAFAKTLLELDDGERLPIDVIPRYDDKNTKVWAKFFEYVQLKESERNDSYLEALLGCLNVHSQLLRVDTSVPEADAVIREELYRHIVQKLEFSLQECTYTMRASTKRERSESPAAPNNRACREDAFGRSRNSRVTLVSSPSGEVMEPLQKRMRRSKMMNSGMHSTELPQRANSDARAAHHETRHSTSDLAKEELESVSKFYNKQNVDHTSIRADPPPDRDSFEIAIVCALPLEYDAILLLIDRFWDESGDLYRRARGDNNIYRTGRMGKFDVVLLLLPEMGKVSAASAAAGLRSSYPGLRLVLLSGICGGVPSRQMKHKKHDEILLGDIIISKAIVQYDLGRRFPDSFEMKDDLETALGRPVNHIRNMLALLEANSVRQELERRSAYFLEQIQLHGEDYEYPGADNDRLFQASYRHKHHRQEQCVCCANCHDSMDPVCESSRNLSCGELGCEDKYLIKRDRLEQNRQLEKAGRLKEAQARSIFVGRVGSGDSVSRSSEGRDTIANQHGILSFEMEGGGIWDELPCIVVKGVCDYADSHKNKKWQDFAAATAASVVKALLERYIKTDSALHTT